MSKDLWPELNRNPTSKSAAFFFVFLRNRSCAFVDRFLIVSEENDPPNHTKKNHTKHTKKVARNFKSPWLDFSRWTSARATLDDRNRSLRYCFFGSSGFSFFRCRAHSSMLSRIK